MPVLGSLCRPIAFILLVATTLSACTSWQVQQVTPEQVVSAQRPKTVRVQRIDGSRVVVDNPRIDSDALAGASKGKPTSVPLADIHQLAVRRTSTGKTIGLVVGLVAIPFVIVGAVCVIDGGEWC